MPRHGGFTLEFDPMLPVGLRARVRLWQLAELATLLLIAGWLALSLLVAHRPPTVSRALDSRAISPAGGFAYVVHVGALSKKILVVPSDESGGSRMQLAEDGRPLGPSSSGHDRIRTGGRGQFSHWGEHIYFSASDNSDPRTNGRRYTFSVPRELRAAPGLWVLGVLASVWVAACIAAARNPEGRDAREAVALLSVVALATQWFLR